MLKDSQNVDKSMYDNYYLINMIFRTSDSKRDGTDYFSLNWLYFRQNKDVIVNWYFYMKLPVWAVSHEIQNVITEVIVFFWYVCKETPWTEGWPTVLFEPTRTNTHNPELDVGHSLHQFKAAFFLNYMYNCLNVLPISSGSECSFA